MADLDNDQVNDIEIGIVGSGSMGSVSPTPLKGMILGYEIDLYCRA